MTERQMIERLKVLKSSNKKSEKLDPIKEQELINRKKRWATFWRNNPNLYIHYKMGSYSFAYQHYSYYQMGDSTTYFDVSTRGVSKTFKAITYGVQHCLLFPFAKVGVAAVTRGQADEDYESTFIGDIVNKTSPFVKWLWNNGLITSKITEKGYRVDFWNGAVMYFFGVIDSSRGLHCDLLIVEECRLIKKNMVDSVVIPMHVLRQPQYKSNPKYITYDSKFDVMKIIYITSNRYAGEWYDNLFNKTFVGFFKDRLNKHRIFCSDIFLAIKYKLKSYNWFVSQKESMGELDFRMEVLNETIGEVEGAYFSRELFAKNQVIKKAWRPPTYEDIKAGIDKNKPKKDNEFRFIFADLAWVGDNDQNKNDNTVIGCASCYLKGNTLIRNVEYYETYGGEKIDDIPLRIKELFWWYKADYVVLDNRSGGELVYVQLTKTMEHPYLSEDNWNSHGFGLCIEKDLHMINNDRYNELSTKTVDNDFIPCIIPILAHTEWNSNMWIDLKNRLKNEDLQLLIDELEFKVWFEEQKEWFKLTSEEKALINIPYIQSALMVNEAVNLTQTWKEGKLTLTAPRNGTKDRIVATAYFNSIASKLENKLLKNAQNDDFDVSQWQLVF